MFRVSEVYNRFYRFILRNNAAIVPSKTSESYANFETRSNWKANIESGMERWDFWK